MLKKTSAIRLLSHFASLWSTLVQLYIKYVFAQDQIADLIPRHTLVATEVICNWTLIILWQTLFYASHTFTKSLPLYKIISTHWLRRLLLNLSLKSLKLGFSTSLKSELSSLYISPEAKHLEIEILLKETSFSASIVYNYLLCTSKHTPLSFRHQELLMVVSLF